MKLCRVSSFLANARLEPQASTKTTEDHEQLASNTWKSGYCAIWRKDMDTHIVKVENGKSYNRFGEQVIDCKTGCGRKTTMTGTKLCDFCWEEDRKDQRKKMNC